MHGGEKFPKKTLKTKDKHGKKCLQFVSRSPRDFFVHKIEMKDPSTYGKMFRLAHRNQRTAELTLHQDTISYHF